MNEYWRRMLYPTENVGGTFTFTHFIPIEMRNPMVRQVRNPDKRTAPCGCPIIETYPRINIAAEHEFAKHTLLCPAGRKTRQPLPIGTRVRELVDGREGVIVIVNVHNPHTHPLYIISVIGVSGTIAIQRYAEWVESLDYTPGGPAE